MTFAVLQQVVVAAAILIAGLYAFGHLAPRSAGRLRAATGRQMARAQRPRWLARMGRRWALAPSAGDCDRCAACSGCSLRERMSPGMRRHGGALPMVQSHHGRRER
jgi:hypothetical protein